MIKLFESTATEFSTLGLGVLNDAIKCVVTEERNGSFELVMEYPIDGIHYSDISLRSIIVSKSNPFSNEQAFRVYYMSKPINGIVTIQAEHISYDLSGFVVAPFKALNVGLALSGLKNNSIPTCNFNFSTDKSVTADFEVFVPSTLRSLLGGVEGSILDVYGTGEYEFDNYNVNFKTHRGSNRGVVVRYGKNLTDLVQEENCTKVYTAVCPFWSGVLYEGDTETDVLVTLPEKILNVEGTFNFTKIMPLDLTDRFSEQPTVDQLRNAAQAYINQNGIGKPEVSLKVSFIQLEQAEEYEQLRLLESVYLCDEVTVKFEALGVDSTAKCVKTEYNAITDKYESLEFGDSRTNLANTIVSQAESIANAPTASFMEQEIARATNMITTEGLGGYVMLHRSSGQLSAPDELLILDENSGGDITKATKVWRFNKAGLGFSPNGYNGPYNRVSITMDGKIVADQIAANGIQAGTVTAALTMIAPTIQNSIINPTFQVAANGMVTGAMFNTGRNADGSYNFSVDSNGYLTSKTGSFSGSLNAATGTFTGTLSAAKGTLSDGTGTLSLSGGNIHMKSNIQNGPGIFADGPGHLYSCWGAKNSAAEDQAGSVYREVATMEIIRAGENASDARLKKDIEPLDEDLAVKLISSIEPKSFKFLTEPDELNFGVVAQDIRKIEEEIGIDVDNCRLCYVNTANGMYSVEMTQLIAPMIKVIQKLQNEVKELREEIK